MASTNDFKIILEAMIKGMGLQGFSSLNYLAEYGVGIKWHI